MTGLSSMIAGILSSPDALLLQPVIVTASLSVSYFKSALTDTVFGSLGSEEASSRELSIMSLTGLPANVSPQPFASALR